ncbi:oxidoreductase [Streptomyces mexicanus]|jgi:hypothetical protein|uniref:oxidoreductase n=1 Tax=Streptomyces mexicanus TaxID=178566 RepID=UPI00367F4678
MSAAYATFGLAPAMRAGEVLADGDHRLHRDYVDFVVDGQPLLHRLSDLDAVSPLASDIPPAIFTAQVRALLLQSEAPLPGGRYVLYGCPECADLACGAVTAVIEPAGPAGEDVLWRDFAWQTGEHADPERDGYPGIGPFRFRGAEYRAVLGALLDGAPRPPRSRVLLIAPHTAGLARHAAALRTIGIGADVTHDAHDVPADELGAYGAVAFGPAAGQEQRGAVRGALARAGLDVPCVDALAPLVPVLVAQIEHALDRSPRAQRRLTGLTASGGAADVEVASACRVRLTTHRLDRLRRTRSQEVLDAVLEPGRHRIPLRAGTSRGEAYVVARTSGGVLVTAMTR